MSSTNYRTQISRENALEILSPYMGDFLSSYQLAFEFLNKHKESLIADGYYIPFSKTYITNTIYQHVTQFAKSGLHQKDGIRFIEHRNILFINFYDKLVVRFKKVDKHLLSSNNPTGQSKALNSQQVIEGLDITTLPILEIGYQPNDTWTGIQSLHIVYKIKKPVWSIPIFTTSIEQSIEFHNSINEPNYENESSVIEKIKLKSMDKDEEKTG